jgi:hypothetical protein
MEAPMKILAAAFCALNIAMLSPSALHPQRETERPEFRVEILRGERGPTYTITNLSGKPVGALVLEVSSSSQPARKVNKVWDSILEGHRPIEPGASLSRPVYELAFSPLPDRIKVIAAVWTDGETFGAPASVNSILNHRAACAAEYEDAAGILQQGLSQNWTRDQYEQAFRDKPDTGAVYTVRTALSATLKTAKTPQDFNHFMQFLLTNFQQLSKQLRKVKPI